MKDLDGTGELHRVDRSKRTAIAVPRHFEHAGPAEPFEHLCVSVFTAELGLPKGKTNRVAHFWWECLNVCSTGPHPEQRFWIFSRPGTHDMPILACQSLVVQLILHSWQGEAPFERTD